MIGWPMAQGKRHLISGSLFIIQFSPHNQQPIENTEDIYFVLLHKMLDKLPFSYYVLW
jgi:hypothetical protein